MLNWRNQSQKFLVFRFVRCLSLHEVVTGRLLGYPSINQFVPEGTDDSLDTFPEDRFHWGRDERARIFLGCLDHLRRDTHVKARSDFVSLISIFVVVNLLVGLQNVIKTSPVTVDVLVKLVFLTTGLALLAEPSLPPIRARLTGPCAPTA